MALLKGILNFFREGRYDLNRYVFYKIVDSNLKEYHYTLQCIHTKEIFFATIHNIVSDIDLLCSLHPIQACSIGIEFAKYLKSTSHHQMIQYTKKSASYPRNRYGNFHLLYQNRKGQICFYSKKSDREHVMNSRDIALSEELIQEFDAEQAFYIGLLSELKIHPPVQKIQATKCPYLGIVK